METHRHGAWTESSTFEISCSGIADGRRASVRPGDDRTRSRACLQEGPGALLADHADGDRERVRRSGPGTNHRRIGELIGACTGVRIKNVMEMPGRLERRAVASGYREGHVIKLDDAVNTARRQRILDTDPPGMAVRVPAQGMEFAEIDHGGFEAFVAQH